MVEKIDKPEAPAEGAEKVKSEKVGGIDSVVNQDAKVEAELEKELNEINAEAKKEVEEKVEKPAKEEKKPKIEKKEEDEPISEDLRKKYKVPDHIKTMKALVEWGPNAEKNMNKALADRDKKYSESTETEKRLAKMEAILENINKVKVEKGGMSEEEKLIKSQRLRDLQDTDPLAYAEELKKQMHEEWQASEKAKIDEANKIEEEKSRNEITKSLAEIQEKQATDLAALEKKYDEKHGEGYYKREVLPAITELAKKEPYVRDVAAMEKLYLYDLREAEEKIKADDEAKRKEKKGLSSEVSHRVADDNSDSDDKTLAAINALPDDASIEELNRIAGVKEEF